MQTNDGRVMTTQSLRVYCSGRRAPRTVQVLLGGPSHVFLRLLGSPRAIQARYKMGVLVLARQVQRGQPFFCARAGLSAGFEKQVDHRRIAKVDRGSV